MERQRVLVTGGAGFLGINLIRHLMTRGYALTSLDVEEFDYPERDRVEVIKGDIRDKSLLDKAIEGANYVVHTAAALPLYSPEDIYTTDVEGTRNVLDAALRHGVKRVVHVSSTAVYGIPDHHPLYETDRLEGVGPYGQAKIQAAYTGHNFPMIGSGDNRYQLLDVEDLCDAISLCLTLPEDRVNDTFNIGAKEFTTMKEDYQAVLDYAGHGKKVVGFPAAPAIWGLRVLDRLRLSPLYKWVYETASRDSFVSIEKAERELGYAPKYSNKDALLRNFRWYLENRDRFEDSSGVSHRVPWKQGAIGFLKRFF